MRLEIERTIESHPILTDEIYETGHDEQEVSTHHLLTQGITAAKAGDRTSARNLLLNVVETEPSNADAWLWLASISEYPEELLGFLDNVLEIDPYNARAREWTASTQLLLAKTMVQRGVAAAEEGQTALAVQYLETALEHDAECEMAWFWKAALADSDGKKVECLERVLLINGENDEARRVLDSILPAPDESMPENTGEVFASDEIARQEQVTKDVTQELLSNESDAAVQTVSEANWDHELDASAPFSVDQMETVETSVADIGFDPGNEDVDQSPVFVCPYCFGENEKQQFACVSCQAVLSMADIEALLANNRLDRSLVEDSITQMEADWSLREFNENELTVLGIGHINLKNYERGLAYLQEALNRNPNNVILTGQINVLSIRINELRRQEEERESMPKGKLVLVVDDSPTVRKLISGKLKKCGHNVVTADDGVVALEMMGKMVPDLVLLDISMPRMDGYEVCKSIRANVATRDVPIVMISGNDGFFDKVRGRVAGATDYITKPFGPEALMGVLETYLQPEADDTM